MVAIVLAAGYATRLYPLTVNVPKALLKIGQMTILDHIIQKINEIDAIKHTVIISNDKFYKNFTEWETQYKDGYRRKTGGDAALMVINDGTNSEQTRLGAIGDISFTINELSIDDEVIIIAGDNFFTYRLIDLYNFYKTVDADCIVVKRHPDRNALKSLGVAVIAPDSSVVDFEEKPQNPKSDLAVYATYIYKRETLPLFGEYLAAGNPKDAPGNFPAWLCKRKRMFAYAFDGDCYDIGTPEAYRDILEKYGIN